MSDEKSKTDWVEKTYITLGIGGLCGLSKLEEPFDVADVIMKLFAGAFLVGCTAVVFLQARASANSTQEPPGWVAISVAIAAAYFITFEVLWR